MDGGSHLVSTLAKPAAGIEQAIESVRAHEGPLRIPVIRGAPSHLDLTVSDLERSTPFYDRVLTRLGYQPLPEAGAGAPCWGVTDSSGGVFSLALKAAGPNRAGTRHDRYAPGLHHLAFHADDRSEVDAFHRFLEEIGVVILDAPAEYDYTPGYYAVFFADPDGLKLEVVHEPALRGETG